MAGSHYHRLYFGRVVHARVAPFAHRFDYGVFSALLNLDHLEELKKGPFGFSHNRFNLVSFHDCDHGPRDGAPLRPWVRDLLKREGFCEEIGDVLLMCYPRILGYVFNPLSVYFCYTKKGSLAAMVYEVSNTFGESHLYVERVEANAAGNAFQPQERRKTFHVSPFLEVKGRYRFRFSDPGEKLKLSIQYHDDDGLILHTGFAGRARDLDTKALLTAFVTHPLMTLKVISAIHWQALKLWHKGARVFSKPASPNPEPVAPSARTANLKG